MVKKFKTQVSVIIPTFGRPLLLNRCLNSIKLASRNIDLNLELLIGVNGVDQKTDNVLNEFVRDSSDVFQIDVFSFKSPLNPGELRNHLLDKSNGDWVYFADDDAYLPENFFNRFTEVLSIVHDADVIGGPNICPDVANEFQIASSRVLDSRWASANSRARYLPTGESRYCGDESLILCNLFVRKKCIPKIPFDTRLKCAEENYFLNQLENQGVKLFYEPKLAVYHERRKTLNGFIRQIFKYGFGRGQLIRLFPLSTRIEHLIPSVCIGFLLFMLFYEPFSLLLMSLLLIYMLGCVFATIRRRSKSDSLNIVLKSYFLFPVLHLFYGLGIISGVTRGK